MNANTPPTAGETAAMQVYCPSCKAQAGDHCRTPSGKLTKLPHGQRYDLASRCGLMPVNPTGAP